MSSAPSAPHQDRAAVRFPPPVIYVVAILAGVVLQRYVLPLPLGLPEKLTNLAAFGAAGFGVGFIAVPLLQFHRSGQSPEPWKSTPEIVSNGIFGLTRNPMYLGMALLQASFGLARGNGWVLLFLPPALLAVYWTVIRHEEAYLERKFGDRYLEYKRAVRRWL